MRDALVKTSATKLGPRMLYSVRAWKQWFRETSDRIIAEHLEHNFASVRAHIQPGSTVLDVGAWQGTLGQALHERLGCQVLNVDVVDDNQTDLPFRTFDGINLPVGDDERFDVVMLLYVLHHSSDDMGLLREARRVVARDGVVLIGEDVVESLGQRLLTVGFHVWLRVFTGMGWKGKFRKFDAWRQRFAQAGLRVESMVEVGSQGDRRLFPKNAIFVLRPDSGE